MKPTSHYSEVLACDPSRIHMPLVHSRGRLSDLINLVSLPCKDHGESIEGVQDAHGRVVAQRRNLYLVLELSGPRIDDLVILLASDVKVVLEPLQGKYP